MSFFEKIRINAAMNSILLIIVGLMFWINPVGSSSMIISIVGIAVVVSGISDLIRYFSARDYVGFGNSALVTGIIKLVLGCYTYTHTGTLISLFSYIISIFILVSGINSMENAMQLRRSNVRGWLVSAILAGLVIFYGIYMLFRPFGAASAAMSIVGIVLLVQGVTDLIAINRMKHIF